MRWAISYRCLRHTELICRCPGRQLTQANPMTPSVGSQRHTTNALLRPQTHRTTSYASANTHVSAFWGLRHARNSSRRLCVNIRLHRKDTRFFVNNHRYKRVAFRDMKKLDSTEVVSAEVERHVSPMHQTLDTQWHVRLVQRRRLSDRYIV